MFPLTLGANIGTTMTGIMAALVSDSVDSLQVALAHLFFNVTGILIFYPIPFMRSIPLYAARRLGKATRLWRGFPIVYIGIMFILVPLLFLGISALFTEDAKGFTVLGSFIVVLLAAGLGYLAYWMYYKDGRQKCTDCLTARERKRITIRDLPDDMDYLKQKVALLLEHTGAPDEEPEDKKEDDEIEA